MVILTKVMAKTVYRIDLSNPPLMQNVSRRDKFMQRVRERKTSSGMAPKKSFSIQGQGNLTLDRNVPVDVESARIKEKVKKMSLPRSASEPGM